MRGGSLHVMRLGWLLVPALAAASAAAQPLASVALGQRIRVDQTDGTRLVGRLLEVTSDSVRVYVERSDSLETLSLQQVRAFAISRGPDRWRGAGWGAAIGGLAGIVIVARAVDYDQRKRDQWISRTAFAIPEAVLLGLITAGIGAVVAPEGWSPQLMARRSAGGMPPEIRVGLALHF